MSSDGAIGLYGPDNRLLVAVPEDEPMTEVCRSFSYKLQAEQYGGAKYESRDFFCSQKTMCRKSQEDEASLAIFAFCKAQVLRDVREYISEIHARKQAAIERRSAA